MTTTAQWLHAAITIPLAEHGYKKFAADYTIGLTTDQVLALGQLLDLQPIQVIQAPRLAAVARVIYEAERHAIAQLKAMTNESNEEANA